jgi:type IV pilus assembly protein PilO
MKNLRRFFTLLNLHLAAVAILFVLVIFFGVKVGLAIHAIHSDQSASFTAQEIRYGQLQAQLRHIHDLPAKVDQARTDESAFVDERIAPDYSTIVAEIGTLAAKENVRLTRATYTPGASAEGITPVRIDASLSGPYSQLMHFINDLERDKHHVFFIITGVALNGQQGGLVNLRLRVDTFLREGATDLPASTPEADTTARLEPFALEVR